MSSGVYYSRLESNYEYMWAFMTPSEEHPAHFGSKTLVNVINVYMTSDTKKWNYAKSVSKFCVLPERVLKWW